jgi:hypothetical protein
MVVGPCHHRPSRTLAPSPQGDSLLEKHRLGRGFDCNERWALRTALYDGGGADLAAAKAAAVAAAAANAQDLEQASVPKSLGVATCGGCGCKCFYAADGPRLQRCRACKAAWYCSEACAKLDFTSHKVREQPEHCCGAAAKSCGGR